MLSLRSEDVEVGGFEIEDLLTAQDAKYAKESRDTRMGIQM
jgi:hypothetical protein